MKNLHRMVLIILAIDALAASALADDSAAEIKAVLTQQAEAWNRGDIDAFMEQYWKSEELTFSSGGQTTREKMGRLTFSHLEITPLGDTAALVLGHWRLEREESPVKGNFSLILRQIDGKWMIVHDHTSKDQ